MSFIILISKCSCEDSLTLISLILLLSAFMQVCKSNVKIVESKNKENFRLMFRNVSYE